MDRKLQKIRFFAIAFFLILMTSSAPGQKAQKYWIFFKDKEIPEAMLQKRSLDQNEAKAYLSERAVERRKKVMRWDSLFDEADLPINEKYIRKLESYGLHVSNVLRWFNAVTAYLTEPQCAELSHTSFVQRIVPVRSFTHRMDPLKQEPVFIDAPLQKGGKVIDQGLAKQQLKAINIIPAHNEGVTGKNVVIGILDAGFRWKTNSALMNTHVLAEYDFIFKDSVTANEQQDDPNEDEHGTSMLTILATNIDGTYVGAVPDASYILAKTEDIRSETKVEEDNWAAAIEWMEGLGVDVVSSSLGYNDFDPQGTNPEDYTWAKGDFNGRTSITAQAALLAVRRGVVVVTAMGNEGNGDGITGTLSTPGDADSVISVGAVRYTNPDSGKLASFSSTGPTNDGRTKPDVVAPGVGVAVATRDGQFMTANGTSCATPLAAGVAALVLSAHPELNPIQVRDAIRNTASNASMPNNFYGWGEVDAYAAIKYYNSAAPVPPITVKDFVLYQNYPNPFNGGTTIRYNIPVESYVTLTICSVFGEKVQILVDGIQRIGSYTINWDGRNGNEYQLPSGVYFISLRTPYITSTKKIILLR
jgi:serine protease AprX